MSGYRVTKDCHRCGRPMRLQDSRRGQFFGCTDYPICKYTEPFDDAMHDITNQLKGAQDDVAYLNDFITCLKHEVQKMRADHEWECPLCSKHLAELEAML